MLEKCGDVYTWGNLSLRPDPPEEVLVELYAEWKRSGVLDWAWYGIPVSLLFFLQWFSRKETSTLACYRATDDHRYWPAGLIWINKTEPLGAFLRAEVGMAFSRGERPAELLRYSQMAIEWAFTERKLSVLAGTTPIKNPAAVRYSKRLGFTVCGPMHGGCVWHGGLDDVMISSMTRQHWAEISPFTNKADESEDSPAFHTAA